MRTQWHKESSVLAHDPRHERHFVESTHKSQHFRFVRQEAIVAVHYRRELEEWAVGLKIGIGIDILKQFVIS